MILDLKISEFIRRQLPHHKRQTNRLKLYTWALREINTLWGAFVPWRKDIIFLTRATGQRISLEALLNRFITNAEGRINITDLDPGGVPISLTSENSDFLWLSTEAEGSDFSEMPIYGELSTDLGYDFLVTIPATASVGEVDEYLKKYTIAGKDYLIQQS